jgi:hypothetical protein
MYGYFTLLYVPVVAKVNKPHFASSLMIRYIRLVCKEAQGLNRYIAVVLPGPCLYPRMHCVCIFLSIPKNCRNLVGLSYWLRWVWRYQFLWCDAMQFGRDLPKLPRNQLCPSPGWTRRLHLHVYLKRYSRGTRLHGDTSQRQWSSLLKGFYSTF